MNPLVNITVIERRGSSWQGANYGHSGLHSLDVARFWAKVRQAPNGCWEWTGSQTGGKPTRRYGQFTYTVRRKQVHIYTHRVAWMIAHGPIPAGQMICHHCDNPLCVKPDHLFIGTQFDNMRDASAKQRLNVPHIRTRGFKAAAIAEYLSGGTTLAAVGEKYGVHMLTILRWVKAATSGDQRTERHRRAG